MGTTAKVIFVNSFKGGAGKTTLALAHCIDGLFHDSKPRYTNIIYMDLDVLGTGTCYLFKDGLLTGERCFERTGKAVEVELQAEKGKKTGSLYVAYLEPSLKTRSTYGEGCFVNHQGIAEEMLKKNVVDFISQQVKNVTDTLIVLDCAPGFTRMEQAVLKECYKMARGKNPKVEVEEEYVTTLDSSHVKKCIQCLNERIQAVQDEGKGQYQNISIIINDVQGYTEYMRRTEKEPQVEVKWQAVADKIVQELESGNIAIRRWMYSEEIAHTSVYGGESVVENHTDCYIFTDENYKTIYPGVTEEIGTEAEEGR